MTTSDLLPCPFCGGDNVKTFGPYGWYYNWSISHSCKSFYNGSQEMFQGFNSEAEAITAWNTRTPTDRNAVLEAAGWREAVGRLLAVFDEQRQTTAAERIITGRSDADLRREGNEAIEALRALASTPPPDERQGPQELDYAGEKLPVGLPRDPIEDEREREIERIGKKRFCYWTEADAEYLIAHIAARDAEIVDLRETLGNVRKMYLAAEKREQEGHATIARLQSDNAAMLEALRYAWLADFQWPNSTWLPDFEEATNAAD